MVGMRHDRAGAVQPGSRKIQGRRTATAGVIVLAAFINLALVLAGCGAQSGRPPVTRRRRARRRWP